jgi:ribonuclease PH
MVIRYSFFKQIDIKNGDQMRLSGRNNNQLREISILTGFNKYAEGSCMVKFGNTHVICTATIDESIPPFLRGKGSGWITAEYGMIPRSTDSRIKRESSQGKQSGRTQEIQRLIGRSLRAMTDLTQLGERQFIVDCDVIQADGGTRCASITGGYVALHLALIKAHKRSLLKRMPGINQIAAVSCGIVAGKVVVDLDYLEDSNAEVDANFIIGKNGQIIEIQACAEKKHFNEKQLIEMLKYAQESANEIHRIQSEVIAKHL